MPMSQVYLRHAKAEFDKALEQLDAMGDLFQQVQTSNRDLEAELQTSREELERLKKAQV